MQYAEGIFKDRGYKDRGLVIVQGNYSVKVSLIVVSSYIISNRAGPGSWQILEEKLKMHKSLLHFFFELGRKRHNRDITSRGLCL